MRYIRPHYYDSFVCMAGECPATCCAGWQIVIDEESLEKYAAETGPFGNRLRNSIDWEEGVFWQYERRCAFLNEENLCDLYKELGETALCRTCTMYPRHVEEFEDSRELSLSLSCPKAAEMILECREKVTFITEERQEEEDFEDFDFLLYTQLEDARDTAFSIIQNREMDLRLRMKMVLALAEEFQKCLDEECFWEIEKVVRNYQTKASKSSQGSESYTEESRFQRMRKGLEVFGQMEHIQPEWETFPKRAMEKLYNAGEEAYLKICDEFDRDFGSKSGNGTRWAVMGEQLLMFFVYTYFCGAVYDDWVYSKMALSVFSTVWIQEMVMLSWLEKGGQADMEDVIRCAWSYAREVEHSDKNLDVLEEWLENDRKENDR